MTTGPQESSARTHPLDRVVERKHGRVKVIALEACDARGLQPHDVAREVSEGLQRHNGVTPSPIARKGSGRGGGRTLAEAAIKAGGG